MVFIPLFYLAKTTGNDCMASIAISLYCVQLRLFILIWLLLSAITLQSQSSLYFTPNDGQWNEPIVAKAVFKGGAIFIEKNGFSIKMLHNDDLPNVHKAFHYRGKDTQFALRGHVIKVSFSGCNASENITIEQSGEASYYENYFFGKNPANWRTEVYPVNRIKLKNVYPGIDFIVYSRGEEIEFDWLVNPGADPTLIKLEMQGQNQISLLENDAVCGTSVGNFTFKKPMAFQGERLVECGFKHAQNSLSFGLGNFDKSKPLIIDPVLIFSTYSGSRGDNFGFTATYDSTGHLYAGGIVDTDQGAYPVTSGAFQTVYGGSGPVAAPVNLPCDVAISKYKPNGSSLVYASYLGGSSNEYPHSLCIDEKNNLLVLGTTLSTDFPVSGSAFDQTHNGNHDLYVAKISSDGKTLIGSTYVGGSANDGINTGALHFNYADDFRGDILADGKGNIYAATCTQSSNFPVQKAAYNSLKGSLEAAVFSLDGSLSSLRWSTFLGGSAEDAAYSVKLDDSANLFVGGGTASNSFPAVGNVYQSSYQGGRADGFVVKMNPDTGSVLKSSFWGTSAYDQVYFLDYDPEQNIYINGQTEGRIIRSAGKYGKDNTTQFIGKLSNDLSSQEWVTTLGGRTGTPELSPCAFMVDKCYNIYFSGWGSDVGAGNAGTTAGLPVTDDANQKNTDGSDFYLLALSKDATNVLYATYFGGNQSDDHVDGGTSRFDKRGVVYQSVCASCPDNPPGLNDFPTTSGSAFPTNVSYRCSNASFKLEFGVSYLISSPFTATPNPVCMPNPIQFTVTTPGVRSKYYWDFGDGNTDSVLNPKHTYSKPGKYRVKLRMIDSSSCNKLDSFQLEVEVLENPLALLTSESELCSSEWKFRIEGQGIGNPYWDFGDSTYTNGLDVTHKYNPGIYMLMVYITHPTSGCKDTLGRRISINADSLQDIRLANVFTPNQDGKNDCYKVVGLNKNCNTGNLKIFNRWGERIYYSDNLEACWDGTVDNNKVWLPEGTYFYQIMLKDRNSKKDKVISGSVNLIR